MFGPDGKELMASSDPATARQNRQVFTVAVRRAMASRGRRPESKDAGHRQRGLAVSGAAREGRSGWRFDTAAGKEEVLARRIGRNELSAIETMRAYVTAQRRYAEQGHDGNPAACTRRSSRAIPARKTACTGRPGDGQKRSPLGDLVAQAAAEGRAGRWRHAAALPFHGYYFKILTAQGAAAPGRSEELRRQG